ncbi:spermatogenesis-associated protein 6 isoform 2-T5 [Discoglossus pictus]
MQKRHSTLIKENGPSRTGRSYEQPTISSKSRSPSPYTKRRMCELSEDAKQRLAHLNLGPYEFKKESDHKPPFVVGHIPTLSPSPDSSPTGYSKGTAEDRSRLLRDSSLYGGYRPIPRKQPVDDLEGSLDDHLLSWPFGRAGHSTGLFHSAPPSIQKHPASPVLHRSSLTERFHSPRRESANWEEIHKRVKNLLRTHSARQRLQFDKNVTGQEDHPRKTSSGRSLRVHELQDSSVHPQETSVHLGNGEFWSNRAAQYRGQSHRAVFEDSMEKIYRNMYRNAPTPIPPGNRSTSRNELIQSNQSGANLLSINECQLPQPQLLYY